MRRGVLGDAALFFVDAMRILRWNDDVQTLGLADSTPRSEGRFKSLFWPSIQNAWDVDYLGQQGFWVCLAMAAVSFVFSLMQGHWISGSLAAVFFILSGIGVREKSVAAAAMVLIAYSMDLVFAFSVLHLIVFAVLLSNLRGTWLASRWKRSGTSVDDTDQPMRLNEKWQDKLVDQLPRVVWPKLRIPYYALAGIYLLLVVLGLGMVLVKGRAPVQQRPSVQPDAVVQGY